MATDKKAVALDNYMDPYRSVIVMKEGKASKSPGWSPDR